MTKEEIISLSAGDELDRLIKELWRRDLKPDSKPSQSLDDAWRLRELLFKCCGGDMELSRFCDEYPEHCRYENGDTEILVWAKTTPEAICKMYLLFHYGHSGDCHPMYVL